MRSNRRRGSESMMRTSCDHWWIWWLLMFRFSRRRSCESQSPNSQIIWFVRSAVRIHRLRCSSAMASMPTNSYLSIRSEA